MAYDSSSRTSASARADEHVRYWIDGFTHEPLLPHVLIRLSPYTSVANVMAAVATRDLLCSRIGKAAFAFVHDLSAAGEISSEGPYCVSH